MFRQAENKVEIVGILSEIDLKYGSFMRNEESVETVGGIIKVLVERSVNNEPVTIEVPVHMFSAKYTKTGKINPSYTNIENVMKNFVSIAACGSREQADKVSISNGTIRMNEFPGRTGEIVSQPRIHASFVSKVIGAFEPKADFSLEFMVSNISRAVDSEGVELEPARVNVQAIVPQYTSPTADVINVDLIPLVAISPSAIEAIENYWEAGSCYKISGRINFSSRTEEIIEQVDFGEPQKKVRTINVNELIIGGGTKAPLEGEFAWNVDDIKAGMAARKVRLEEAKNRTPKAPAKTSTKKEKDLGF